MRKFSVTLAGVIALAAGCADAPTSVSNEGRVEMRFLTPATVRTVVVTVAGPGITPALVRNIPIGTDSTARDTLTLPAGSSRAFRVQAFDSLAVETHRADTVLTVQAGANTLLALRLVPLSSQLGITITFGGFTLTIADTSLRQLEVGDTAQLDATLRAPNGTSMSADSLVLASTNPGVLRVEGRTAIAVRAGDARLVASISGAAAGVGVRVRDRVFAPPGVLALGGTHTCALDINGAMHCWGGAGYGELGDGSSGTRTVPNPVNTSLKFTQVAVGARHTCGLASDGKAHCWGAAGTLGDGSSQNRTVPGPVSGDHIFTTIVGGGVVTCGVVSTGGSLCWGGNEYGGVGDGTRTLRLTPVAVSSQESFVAFAPGGHHLNSHTCALKADGAARCWGYNAEGQLGTGSRDDSSVPVAVSGGLSFVRLSVGIRQTCGLTASGTLHCWGGNEFGQLGDSTTVARTIPVRVIGGRRFSAVAAGGLHSCALEPTGAAYCWGDNREGQLGDGTATSRVSPVPVKGGLRFVAIGAGNAHTCGLTDKGDAYCWGWNISGQLGNGNTATQREPVKASGGVVFRTR